MRIPIAYGRVKPVMIATGMPPSTAFLELDDTKLVVRMGWGFKATVPLESIINVEALDTTVISIGVHGWNGKWLVNGKGSDLVRIDIDPPVKARAVQVPIKLRKLTVSVEDPDTFVAQLIGALPS